MNYCIMPEYVITGLQFLTFGLVANIIGWGALIWAIFRFRRGRDEWRKTVLGTHLPE